ncbi:MAG: DUF805 domain-containing protein [Robiginitomaculum sp.]|nr:DUF805 domain-containing protein [Robiginitomaculum sp.]
MGPIEAVTSVITKSFNFRGRASRSEFWWFYFIASIIYLLILAVTAAIYNIDVDMQILPIKVFTLLILLPYVAVFTRRLNDVGCRLWQHIVYWLYVPLAMITNFMLSGALPEWAGMTYAIFILVWVLLWIFVHIQLLRKGQGGDATAHEYENENQAFVPELYVPPAQPASY